MLAVLDSTYVFGIGAGIFAAILFGSGDFYVGHVASKSSVFASTAVAYIFEFCLLGTLLFFQKDYGTIGENNKTLLVAISGNIGFLTFVYGLAKGRISIVAPLAAILQLVFPLIFSIFVDNKTLSRLTWLGIMVSIIAIIFITITKEPEDSKIKNSTKLSIFAGTISGLCFSLWLTGISKVETPIITRIFILSIPACIVGTIYLLVKRDTIKPVLKYVHIIVISSTGYMCGIWFFNFSERRVSLIISALLIGLVPAVTIILAKIKNDEHISKNQYYGFILAIIGIGVIALGST
ncbi:MAG: EamA family transporter [Acidimicrobiia bacterium]|nr:EamA family transporter [Acidimicrobiia bacterium]